MAADGKKGITVKVDAALHAEITQYLQDHGMTMTEFVTLALQDELHPKIDEKEGKNMEKMRTLAFQVPESLFQRIKDYLHRNNMTQKDFVIGLIEQELDRDLAESQETGEAQGDFEDTEELEDTEQLDADQELLEDAETASSAEDMDEAEPSISDQEEPETSEEGPDAEELDDEMSPLEEKGESEDQDDEDIHADLNRFRAILDSIGKVCGYPNLESLFLTRDIPPTPKAEFKAYSDGELKPAAELQRL